VVPRAGRDALDRRKKKFFCLRHELYELKEEAKPILSFSSFNTTCGNEKQDWRCPKSPRHNRLTWIL